MSLKEWRKLSESVLYANPWWRYKRDSFELPSGKQGEYHYVHTNGSAMVVPFMPNGRILMVNQYRYLCSRESLEFPCGSVKDGSTHDETARHELAEETGYSAKQMVLAGEFNPYNGITDEICRVYIARELAYVGADPDETEDLENVEMTPSGIDGRIVDGTLWDGMTMAAWCLVRSRIDRGGMHT